MHEWAVSLFGRVRVVCGDRVVDDRAFPSRKAKQVLQLLALARGSAVTKEQLIEQIWGERLPRNPVATLEHTVSILRAKCFSDAPRPAIVTANASYRLDTTSVSVDLIHFDQLVRAAAHGAPRQALQLLTEAVDLATGEVLEDERDAEWATVARNDYRRRVERAALQAARLALLEVEPEVALDLAERAQRLAIVPSEDAYQLQASALIRLGRRADALVLLRDAAVALDRELGVRLAPATLALREMIVAPPVSVVGATSLRLTIDATMPRRAVPFVGRAAELDRIGRLAERLSAGASELVIFEGPSGIGKTRLLDEIGPSLAGVRVCRLGCSSPGRTMARFTASRLLRAVAAGASASDSASSSTPPAPGSDPTTLYEQLASLIEQLGPTLVLIDDVHWADEESLAIIDGLAGRDGINGFGVVATRHSGSADGARRQLPSATRIDLLPCTDDDLRSAGMPVGSRVTGGVPIVLMAFAESQHNDGSISTATVDALLARTHDAGPLAHEVLVVAAATSHPLSVYEIAYALGLGTDLAGALVDQLVQRHLLTRGDSSIELADEITGQVLRGAIGEDRARSIRAMVGHVSDNSGAVPADAG